MSLHLAVINPNTDARTTCYMTGIVRAALPSEFHVSGHTMQSGPSVISNEAELAAAADQIMHTGTSLRQQGIDGVLIAGFGDPGLETLRERLDIPVTGIAEAGIRVAATNGRRFSIITTTTELSEHIRHMVRGYGYEGSLASLRVTEGDLMATMSDLHQLQQALLAVARLCTEEDGAKAILIGGGPLAPAAPMLARTLGLPVVEPVRAGGLTAGMRLKAQLKTSQNQHAGRVHHGELLTALNRWWR